MDFTQKQLEAAKLLNEAIHGSGVSARRAVMKLQEGISTSDIPVQLTPTMTRLALNDYENTPSVWQEFASREVVQDFESHPYYSFAWGDEDIERENAGSPFVSGGLAHVPEYDEYPVIRLTATEIQLGTKKHGVQLKLSWESMFRTGNFGIIPRTFAEFGRRAKNQEDIEATKVLVTGSGVNTANFNAGNNNVATGAAIGDITVPVFQEVMNQLAGQTFNGRRVQLPASWALVVPRTREAEALRFKELTGISDVSGAGTTEETRYDYAGNPFASKVDIVVNDWLNQVDPTFNGWFLIPKPGSTPNPSVVNVFLQGEETPKVFVQKTTTSAEIDGAYIDDSYSTKVRHVVQGGFIDPSGTFYNPGA